jgi:isocitrate/isopropylmalate dehydrogenase
MQTNKVSITIAHGDGIGPEIMAATLKVLKRKRPVYH